MTVMRTIGTVDVRVTTASLLWMEPSGTSFGVPGSPSIPGNHSNVITTVSDMAWEARRS